MWEIPQFHVWERDTIVSLSHLGKLKFLCCGTGHAFKMATMKPPMGSASARASQIAITFRFLEFKYQSFCLPRHVDPPLLK